MATYSTAMEWEIVTESISYPTSGSNQLFQVYTVPSGYNAAIMSAVFDIGDGGFTNQGVTYKWARESSGTQTFTTIYTNSITASRDGGNGSRAQGVHIYNWNTGMLRVRSGNNSSEVITDVPDAMPLAPEGFNLYVTTGGGTGGTLTFQIAIYK